MIDGLKFDVKSEELVKLFRDAELRQRDIVASAALLAAKTHSGLNRAYAEAGHRAAAEMAFLAEHVIPNETYRLEVGEVRQALAGFGPRYLVGDSE